MELGVMTSERRGAGLSRHGLALAAGFIGAIIAGIAFAGLFEDAWSAYGRSDYATAMRLFRRLADQGNADAQANLGFMYQNGQGVQQDDKQAVVWYRKAADQGNARAQTNLGFMYEGGRGVPKDYKQAVAWYRKAADQGNADAQANLGAMYQHGRPRQTQRAQGIASQTAACPYANRSCHPKESHAWPGRAAFHPARPRGRKVA
jgi:TPR repeat protein